MAKSKLADIVVEFIEFLELAGDESLNPDTAVRQGESIAAHLAQATDEERLAVQAAAREKLASVPRGPDEYGYFPKLSPEHRRLLETIATGVIFGWSDS
jgi:hypothetical protein